MTRPAVEAAVSAPPLTLVGMSFLGYALDDWLKLLGIVWIVLQMGHFIWTKIIRKDK